MLDASAIAEYTFCWSKNFGEMLDTSLEKRREYYSLLRGLSEEQRANKAASLSRTVRALAMAGIQAEHPDAPPEELRARLAVRLYGPDAARTIFGHVPLGAR